MENLNSKSVELIHTLRGLLEIEFGVEFTKISDTLNHLSQLKHLTGLIIPQGFRVDPTDINMCNNKVISLRISFIVRETDEKAVIQLLQLGETLLTRLETNNDIFNKNLKQVTDTGFDSMLSQNNLIHCFWIEADFNLI